MSGIFISRGSKRSHTLRYVLRNRVTDEVYLAVVFSLYLKEDVNEDGSLKPGALQPAFDDEAEGAEMATSKEHDEFDEKSALDQARKTLSQEHLETKPPGLSETSPDDVD
jgi:hypothetical protein